VLNHILNNLKSTLRVIEIAVLDSRLNHIERGADKQTRRGTANRRNEVLKPRRLVIVLELEQVTLGERRSSEQCEGARRVAGGRPLPATIETKAFVADDGDDAAATEGFGVGLTLNFEDVEREENDLADAD
jgi:hypothetical protein